MALGTRLYRELWIEYFSQFLVMLLVLGLTSLPS
jgi:hypothetical protein